MIRARLFICLHVLLWTLHGRASQEERTIVLIGPTGSSKTSLSALFEQIMLNNIDKFSDFKSTIAFPRPSAESDTLKCTIYDLQNSRLKLRIIDTPGFNDTNGRSDDSIIDEIRNVLSQQSINGVLVVLNAATANRDTPEIKSFYASFKKLFSDEGIYPYIKIIAGHSDAGTNKYGNMLVGKTYFPGKVQYAFSAAPFLRSEKLIDAELQEVLADLQYLNINVFNDLIEGMPEEPLGPSYFQEINNSVSNIKDLLERAKISAENLDRNMISLQKVEDSLALEQTRQRVLGENTEYTESTEWIKLVNKKTGATCYKGPEKFKPIVGKDPSAGLTVLQGLGGGSIVAAIVQIGNINWNGAKHQDLLEKKKVLERGADSEQEEIETYNSWAEVKKRKGLWTEDQEKEHSLKLSKVKGARSEKRSQIDTEIKAIEESFDKEMKLALVTCGLAAISTYAAFKEEQRRYDTRCTVCGDLDLHHGCEKIRWEYASVNPKKAEAREANKAKISSLISQKQELEAQRHVLEVERADVLGRIEMAIENLNMDRSEIFDLSYLVVALKWEKDISLVTVRDMAARMRSILGGRPTRMQVNHRESNILF